jgi:hypothetical protein
MVSIGPVSVLKSQQRTWAAKAGIPTDDAGYCLSCDANLFEPLSACSRREFSRGDGSELGKHGQRGKIQALHSSAALAVNFFDYWRGRDLGVFRQLFGLASRPCGLTFEHKFPTGLGGIAPNVDIVLHQCDGSVLAVESKFTEPFVKSASKNFLKAKYFPADTGLWHAKGLAGCQVVADALHGGTLRFDHLDAAQLLKHMLGLANDGRPWVLSCLWFDAGGPESRRHADELAVFAQRLGPDTLKFAATSYQSLFSQMMSLLGQEHRSYLSYLGARYFVEPVV